MATLHYLTLFFPIVYVLIILGLFYLIYIWVNKFIYLKQEQNDLLREFIKRMDSK